MSKILKFELKKDKKVGENTSSYVDDIYVKRDVVSGDAVVNNLKKYGLKAPVGWRGSTRTETEEERRWPLDI